MSGSSFKSGQIDGPADDIPERLLEQEGSGVGHHQAVAGIELARLLDLGQTAVVSMLVAGQRRQPEESQGSVVESLGTLGHRVIEPARLPEFSDGRGVVTLIHRLLSEACVEHGLDRRMARVSAAQPEDLFVELGAQEAALDGRILLDIKVVRRLVCLFRQGSRFALRCRPRRSISLTPRSSLGSRFPDLRTSSNRALPSRCLPCQ